MKDKNRIIENIEINVIFSIANETQKIKRKDYKKRIETAYKSNYCRHLLSGKDRINCKNTREMASKALFYICILIILYFCLIYRLKISTKIIFMCTSMYITCSN